jgi:hypothetical protein
MMALQVLVRPPDPPSFPVDSLMTGGWVVDRARTIRDHAIVQVLNRLATSLDEQAGQKRVYEAGSAGKHHAAAKATRRLHMLKICFSHAPGVVAKISIDHRQAPFLIRSNRIHPEYFSFYPLFSPYMEHDFVKKVEIWRM